MAREYLSWWCVQLVDSPPERWRRLRSGKIDFVAIAPATPSLESIERIVVALRRVAHETMVGRFSIGRRADGRAWSNWEAGGQSRRAEQNVGPRLRPGLRDADEPRRVVLEPSNHLTQLPNQTGPDPLAAAATCKIDRAGLKSRWTEIDANPDRSRSGLEPLLAAVVAHCDPKQRRSRPFGRQFGFEVYGFRSDETPVVLKQ
jgi:hypothetical protein